MTHMLLTDLAISLPRGKLANLLHIRCVVLDQRDPFLSVAWQEDFAERGLWIPFSPRLVREPL